MKTLKSIIYYLIGRYDQISVNGVYLTNNKVVTVVYDCCKEDQTAVTWRNRLTALTCAIRYSMRKKTESIGLCGKCAKEMNDSEHIGLIDDYKRETEKIFLVSTETQVINPDISNSLGKNDGHKSLEDINKEIEIRRHMIRNNLDNPDVSEDDIKNIEKEIQEYLEMMKKVNQFDIYENDEMNEEQWILCTSICSIGGCGMGEITFQTYEEALKEGYKMSLDGKQMTIGGACSSCISELQEYEVERVSEKNRRNKELSDLRGTGEVIKEIVDVECLSYRQFYDSKWKIILKTDSGEEKTINLLYTDTNSKASMYKFLSQCKTIGDIKSNDQTGLIYYD